MDLVLINLLSLQLILGKLKSNPDFKFIEWYFINITEFIGVTKISFSSKNAFKLEKHEKSFSYTFNLKV